MRDSPASVNLKALRTLQLELALFNQVIASVIFVLKTAGLGIVITCGFGSIQLVHTEDWIVGIFNFFVALDSAVDFNLMYNRGYAIPRYFSNLKRSLVFRVRRMDVRRGQLGIMEKQLRSIRPMAVKVGSFHTLQRVSTLLFVDFAVKNIARFVMTFNKNVR